MAQDALRVTLETTLIAQTLILLVGTPAAYLLANARFPGRNVAITATCATPRPSANTTSRCALPSACPCSLPDA